MNRRTVLRLGAKVLLGGVATRALSGCSSTEPPSAPNNPLKSSQNSKITGKYAFFRLKKAEFVPKVL